MSDVHIYKIGLDNYHKQVDKNGGLSEFKLIQSNMIAAVYNAKQKVKNSERVKRTLFIVNGITDRKAELFEKMLKAKEEYETLVFVLTDYNFIEANEEIIKLCDILLHQSPIEGFTLFGLKSYYSFIPELFYTKYIQEPAHKSSLCFFGGNISGREKTIQKFLLEEDGQMCKQVMMFYKSADGKQDYRIQHDQYRKMMSLFKFAFITGRDAGQEVGWVTPRVYEAIAANCIPIVTHDYDKENYFGLQTLKVSTYAGFVALMAALSKVSYKEMDQVHKLREKAIAGANQFEALVEKVIKM